MEERKNKNKKNKKKEEEEEEEILKTVCFDCSYFTTGPLTRGGFEILCLLRQISTSFSSAI